MAELNAADLRRVARMALRGFYVALGPLGKPEGVYGQVLACVEPALLEETLRWCGGNQVKAAEVLGLNRGTLRKKLALYGIDARRV